MIRTPRVFVGAATVRVPDARCGHCLDAASAAVRRVAGVRSVAVDAAAGTVTVRADVPVDLADVAAAIEQSGHSCAPVR